MTKIPANTKIFYVPDMHNKDRTLTLAYSVIDNTITFGWAVNTPTKWVQAATNRNTILLERKKGDRFCKRKGREIAIGRLNKVATTLIEVDSVSYRTALMLVLDFLSCNNENRTVRRIAKQELEYQRWCDSMSATYDNGNYCA